MSTRVCEECGRELIGRVDRKYCSAACRQKRYRHAASNRNVTADAVPYDIGDDWPKHPDPFWNLLFALNPVSLPPARPEEDTDHYGEEDPYGTSEGILVGGARTKRNDASVERCRKWLQEFADNYESQRLVLERMHATARELLSRDVYQQEG